MGGRYPAGQRAPHEPVTVEGRDTRTGRKVRVSLALDEILREARALTRAKREHDGQ